MSDVLQAPFDVYRDRVRPEWIDHNGHMNMGYYLVVFDLATDEFFRWVGLDDAHRRARGVTTFSLETHVTYQREVGEGEMWHAEAGYLAATNELMSLHVSLETRRAAPMAPEVLDRLGAILASHEKLPLPAQAGRSIGLEKRPTAL